MNVQQHVVYLAGERGGVACCWMAASSGSGTWLAAAALARSLIWPGWPPAAGQAWPQGLRGQMAPPSLW